MTVRTIEASDKELKGLSMPVMQEEYVRSSRRTLKVRKSKDLQYVSNVSQKQLEDQYLCLKEESALLKQHVHMIEQKLYRFSTKLSNLRNKHSGLSGRENIGNKDSIEELKDHVVTLESQKEVLERKLNMARKQIPALCQQAHQSPQMGQGVQEGEATQTTQTVPAHYSLSSMDDYKRQTKRLFTEPEAVRLTELELAIQSLRETFQLKEKKLQYPMEESNKRQVDELRLSIKNNINVIRLQKQLSNERTALLVIKEKFTVLKQAYETQLEEGQRSVQVNQEALLGKVGQLNEQLKQEKKKALILEGQLNTATISLHSLAELQEKVSDIEGERNILKRSYNALLHRTLSGRSQQNEHESEKESDAQEVENCKAEMVVLKKKLEDEKSEREKLKQEKKRAVEDYETSQIERAQERAMTTTLREKHEFLEQEVLQCRQNVTSLQERLDRVSKDFQTDVEDLSEILMQIKAFRLQQESCKGLTFLVSNEKVKDQSKELAAQQVSHVETILELQKTRELLVMQQRINNDLQAYMNIERERAEREREWRKREVTEKDKLSLQINRLQDWLRNLTYRPGNGNQNMPHQYTWTRVDQESYQIMEGNTILNGLQDGGSLLEISLIGATFTPVGLRLMREQEVVGTSGPHEVVTFCTYSFLDFEMHSTPLVSGTQPNYGFTSCYVLTGNIPTKLEGQRVFAHVEVHQALGGVQFITQGRARIPLIQALQHSGEKVKGRVNITGFKGELIGILEFWLRLFSEVVAKDVHRDRMIGKNMDSVTDYLPIHRALYWTHNQPEELFEHGGRSCNELVVVLERCVGVCWQGLHPNAYLIHRLYDLPPHSSPSVPSCTDPASPNSNTYPLVVTADLIEYLKVSSLWVYMIDDSEEQSPTNFLAKTPVPLQALITGKPIKGSYVLRDPAGVPRGIVRVYIQWRYPFKSPEALSRPTLKWKSLRDRKQLKKFEDKKMSLSSAAKLKAMEQEDKEKGEKVSQPISLRDQMECRVLDSLEYNATSDNDVIIPQLERPVKEGCRLKIEILSLLFDPSSSVALDQSVQQVYVEYRLLDIPVATTETPMSLKKPTEGEEIHFNFSRVIHVNSMKAAPLKQYLYTKLEKTDAKQGRLKFTVVSEPLNEEDECVDVGHAYLDLRELLLTGNDVTECQIDIVRIDGDQEVVGRLKVSLEAAQALTGIS
ncbi:protein fantom [Tachysurus vachellii]|uniref:protein fantom n=1 Tax=Tachysurus vachellii TaxID=175792 RepID=UPI00296B3094|nr:protein fantom [Tachysurus vachellii]